MKKTSSIVGLSLILLFLLVPIFIIIFELANGDNYYESLKWNCTNEEFDNVYCEQYRAKLLNMKSVYALEYQDVEEINEHGTHTTYLYNNNYTVMIDFSPNGYYSIDLMFYGDETGINNYEKQRDVVDFINTFTNYIAYDTKTDKNYFEYLYNESLKSEDKYATHYYHYDSLVGNVGYYVALDKEIYGYYYKMLRDNNIKIKCNVYRFEGLLKPLDW